MIMRLKRFILLITISVLSIVSNVAFATKIIAGWEMIAYSNYWYEEPQQVSDLFTFLYADKGKITLKFYGTKTQKFIGTYRITSLRKGKIENGITKFHGDVIDESNGEIGHMTISITIARNKLNSVELSFPNDNLFVYMDSKDNATNYGVLKKLCSLYEDVRHGLIRDYELEQRL